jgi:hypothetical protein
MKPIDGWILEDRTSATSARRWLEEVARAWPGGRGLGVVDERALLEGQHARSVPHLDLRCGVQWCVVKGC